MIKDMSFESREAIEQCKNDIQRYIGYAARQKESIHSSIKEQGELQDGMAEALKKYMLPFFPEGLPSGDSCERAVAEICEIAAKCVNACKFKGESGESGWEKPEEFEEAFRGSISRNAHAMPAESAMRYVLSLIYTAKLTGSTALDTYLHGVAGLQSEDALQQELEEVIAGLSELSEDEIWAKVDGCIALLEPEVLSSAILNRENETFIDAAWGAASGKLMADTQRDAASLAEQYAIDACAFYIAVAQGQIPEIPPTAPPAAIALYFISNLAAAQVRMELKENQISASLAEKRLRKLSQTVATLLASLLAAAVFIGGAALIAYLAYLLAMSSIPPLLCTASMAPLVCCWVFYGALIPDGIEDLSDALDGIFKRLELKLQEMAARRRLQKRETSNKAQYAYN